MKRNITIVILSLLSIVMQAQDRLVPTDLTRTTDDYYEYLLDSLVNGRGRWFTNGYASYLVAPSFSPEYALKVNCKTHELVCSKAMENIYYRYFSNRTLEEILEEYEEDEIDIDFLDESDWERIRSEIRYKPEIKRDTLEVSDSLCVALSCLIDYAVYTSAFGKAEIVLDGERYVFLSQYYEATCHSPRNGLSRDLVELMDKCCTAVSQHDRKAVDALLPEIKSMTVSYQKLYFLEPIELKYHVLRPYSE